MNRLLIVEDEENLRTGLTDFFRDEGFEVSAVENVAMAKTEIGSFHPHVIVLDWKLPDGTGIDLLKHWRASSVETPVIFLTSRSDLIDKVLGLEIGANDYVTKPFEPRELLARVHVQLRSKTLENSDKKVFSNGIEVDDTAKTVSYMGSVIELTKMEYSLLKFFMERPGQAFSRDEILNQIWGMDQFSHHSNSGHTCFAAATEVFT